MGFTHRFLTLLCLRGGFKPTDIPGLLLWLKADAITGLVDGEAVATWTDLSGRGNDLSQANVASRPTYQSGAGDLIGGRPIVRGDGVDDVLQRNDALGLTGNPALSLYIVIRNTAVDADDGIFGLGDSGGLSGGKVIGYSEGTDGPSFRFNDGKEVFGTADFSTACIATWVRGVGDNYVGGEFYLNGIEVLATRSGGDATLPNITNQETTLFNRSDNGGALSLAAPADIGEVILYNAEHDAPTRQKVLIYLSRRWHL